MAEFLKTDRLILRNFRKEDFPAVFSWRNDAACAKFQRWNDTTEDAVMAYLRRHEDDVFLSDKDEQHYAISDTSGAAVGELACFYNPEDACITLGITIAPEFQGQGLAFELLSAAVQAIREIHTDMDIVGLIHPDNKASIRLFEKLGFVLECYAKSIDSCVYTLFATNLANGT